MKQDMTTTLIERKCEAVKAMLLAKNAAYGNSALDPVRVFSKAPIDEQIRVRLDDGDDDGPLVKGESTHGLRDQVRDFQSMVGRPSPSTPAVPDADTMRLRL